MSTAESSSAQLVDKIKKHIALAGLGPNDLLFAMRQQEQAIRPSHTVPDPETFETTKSDAAGRRYRHGTAEVAGSPER